MNVKQAALAAEVRAEMARQNVKAAAIQRALGVSSTAWGTYFVQCTRDIPLSVIYGVAEHLGLTGAELLRRTDEALARKDPATAQLEAMLSPAALQAVEQARADIRRAEAARAEEQPEDPPDDANGRRHSA
jgi:hypothetical protein